MKHHKIGDIVPLGGDIYMVQKVENGWVYLRQPNARGKQKRLYWREVPYFEDGKLVIPTIEKLPRFNSKIHLGSFFKKHSGDDFQVSKEYIAFAYEMIDDLLHRILDDSIANALDNGDRRLMPAHFRPIYYSHNYRYYEEDQNDYARKESAWLQVDKDRREVEEDDE